MRSSHADYFNHDDGAVGYDDDVLNESDPESRVLELGSGTGNLTSRLPEYHETICVDVSEKMEELALAKGARFPNRKFIKDDVLAVFDRNLGCFDSIVSTYTLHHLTEPQKVTLFGKLWSALNDGGVAVIGDLMVESADQLANKVTRYRNEGYEDVATALEEEFFWHLTEAICELERVGFQVSWIQFSDLSYGILAKKARTCQAEEAVETTSSTSD